MLKVVDFRVGGCEKDGEDDHHDQKQADSNNEQLLEQRALTPDSRTSPEDDIETRASTSAGSDELVVTGVKVGVLGRWHLRCET